MRTYLGLVDRDGLPAVDGTHVTVVIATVLIEDSECLQIDNS